MPSDQPILSSGQEDIDLSEVFAALQRRWGWVVGSCLLGLALATGLYLLKLSSSEQEVEASLVVNISQGPCHLRNRKLSSYKRSTVIGIPCFGEFESMRQRLNRLVKNNSNFLHSGKSLDYSIDRLAFDGKGGYKIPTHLVLSVIGPSSMTGKMSAALEQIQREMTLLAGDNAKVNGFEPLFGSDWIRIQKPQAIDGSSSQLPRLLTLVLLGSLVFGAGCALIADRTSNRVYSREELLRRLSYPLRLGLPSGPWSSPAVSVLVGQLATQLDKSLSWRVLSIARQHEAVVPFTELLQQQGGTDLQCNSADPLLSVVLHLEPLNKPTGLLLVVEPGFNSARAIEESRLLISQMSAVQAVGVVLIGAPLPDELSSSVAG